MTAIEKPAIAITRHSVLWPNRLVGILHGCLLNQTLYDEGIAWSVSKTEAA
jgi:hypothetical protein